MWLTFVDGVSGEDRRNAIGRVRPSVSFHFSFATNWSLTLFFLLAGKWNTHTHTRLTALFPGLPGWAGTRKVKPIWILLKQETVAVASAGPYASLHLAPDRQPHQHPTTQFFTGRMPFLPPNQQRQCTEGWEMKNKSRLSCQSSVQRCVRYYTSAYYGVLWVLNNGRSSSSSSSCSIPSWRHYQLRAAARRWSPARVGVVIIISFSSPTLSFISHLKPSFSANASHSSLSFSSSGLTTWFPRLLRLLLA